jgi:hypothetical protein
LESPALDRVDFIPLRPELIQSPAAFLLQAFFAVQIPLGFFARLDISSSPARKLKFQLKDVTTLGVKKNSVRADLFFAVQRSTPNHKDCIV